MTIWQQVVKRMTPANKVQMVILCLIFGCLGWMGIDLIREELARKRGAADAQADLARGQFHYRLRGLGRVWQHTAIETAARDYGIQVKRTGGCVCSGPDCSYDLAYNRVMHDDWKAQLGFDPIVRAFDQAHDAWRQTSSAASAETPVDQQTRTSAATN